MKGTQWSPVELQHGVKRGRLPLSEEGGGGPLPRGLRLQRVRENRLPISRVKLSGGNRPAVDHSTTQKNRWFSAAASSPFTLCSTVAAL